MTHTKEHIQATFQANVGYIHDVKRVRIGTIAALTGVTPSAASMWRIGSRMPGLPTMLQLAELFSAVLGYRVTVDDLLTRDLAGRDWAQNAEDYVVEEIVISEAA